VLPALLLCDYGHLAREVERCRTIVERRVVGRSRCEESAHDLVMAVHAGDHERVPAADAPCVDGRARREQRINNFDVALPAGHVKRG
jgi:hypothetical protein